MFQAKHGFDTTRNWRECGKEKARDKSGKEVEDSLEDMRTEWFHRSGL
jgi:hypothetical protein